MKQILSCKDSTFSPIRLEDHVNLRSFFKEQKYSLCEYSLASVFVWNKGDYEVSFKIEGDTLLIAEKEIGPSGDKRLIMPLTAPFRAINPSELASLAIKNGFERYYHVPEDYVKNWGSSIDKYFRLQEQPGFMDYIYRTSDMVHMGGPDNKKMRNLVSQFNKHTAKSRQVRVEPMNATNCTLSLDLLERWKGGEETHESARMLDYEHRAIKNSLNNFEPLEMEGLMVFIDGEISAFALGSQLSKDTFNLNFEKANRKVNGLYQFLDNEFAKKLISRYAFVNKESDLGKPGLISSKEYSNPIRKIRSFALTVN